MITNSTHFNTTELTRLIKDLYNILGMKICIYDTEGNIIIYYPEESTSLCEYIRKNPILDKKCSECDKKAMAICRKTKQVYVYQCHINLTECIAPIIINETIKGFVILGQLRETENDKKVLDNLKSCQLIDSELASEYYNSLPILHKEKIKSIAHVIEACASYTALQQLIEDNDNSLATKIDSYIDNHLKGNLSVDILCNQFGLSRREIYNIFQSFFDSTPADYVRLRRLHYSTKLLKENKYSITKIAELSGIGDYNYYSKLFKKTFKLSPSEYRKKQLNDD